ncbi:MAG: HEAT repeat domain-containing protein [Proteobacteria bacterium]|nr:HEAT repeat domain-containing protein [Pseudomonadota bacterium]
MTVLAANSDNATPRNTGATPPNRVSARLSEILREGVDIHRTLAAQALGAIGRRDGVPALLDALLDEDPDVRVDAATALGLVSDPSTAPKLMDNLIGDPDTGVKLAVLDALVAMRHEAVVPWLIRLLKGRDEEMAWDEDAIYQDGWDDWVDMQVKAITGLAAFGVSKAVPDVIEAINDEFGQDLSETGFRALVRMGEPGIAALAGYLDGKDIRLRRRAAAVLATSDAPTAREAVGRALKAKSAELRTITLRAVAARNPRDERLAELFVDRQTEIRAETVLLIGRLYPARAAILLRDSNWDVQRAVLELIATAPSLFDGEELAELIRTRLQSESVDVGAAALKAISALLGEDALADIMGILTDRDIPLARRLAAIAALGRIGGEHAVAGFTAVLGGGERQIRLDAMGQLANLADDGEWPNPAGYALLAALRGELVQPPEIDESEEAAAEETAEEEPEEFEDEPAPAYDVFPTSTLAAIIAGDEPPSSAGETSQSVEPVVITEEDEEFLELSRQRAMRKQKVSPNPKVAAYQDVRRFAARVLGNVAQHDVARALAEALADDDEDVRLTAVDSLAQLATRLDRLPGDANDILVTTTGSDSRDMRLAAVRALGAVVHSENSETFRERLEDADPFVRAEAIRGLMRAGGDTAEVEKFLTEKEPGVREAAADAIAGVGGAEAVDHLVDFAFFRDGFHKERAARLLCGVDAAAATDRFLDVLDDDERMRVWAVAIMALADLNRPQTEMVPTV